MSPDTLSAVLRSVRLHGARFYHVEGMQRWVIEAPSAADIAGMIMPGVDHVMACHMATHGTCWAALAGAPAVALHAGDVVLFPRGDPHVMSSDPGLRGNLAMSPPAMPLSGQLSFFASQRGGPLTMARLDRGVTRGAALVCGFLGCDAHPFNPLLASLPSLLYMPAGGDSHGRGDWVARFIRFALEESLYKRPGGEVLLERLSEILFVEVVRRYLESLPAGQADWLAGLQDRHVGRALALLHASPADPWTIDRLAERTGLSRSALHARFHRFTGLAPMHYLAKWRMQLAAGLLRQSNASVASIALEVGYESEAAFSRAFRRETCLPPATWRHRQHRLATRE